MKIIFFTIVLVYFLSNVATAGEVTSKVQTIQVNVDNSIAVLTMEQASQGSPACGKNDKRFVINLALDGGKAALSTLLTAKAQNKTVSIFGTNSCPIVGYLENISFLRIH